MTHSNSHSGPRSDRGGRDTAEAGEREQPRRLERIDAYDYALPEAQIADQPAQNRTGSRLLEVTSDGCVHHPRFSEITRRLRPGDLLVVNDVQVRPVRLYARRETGGRVEVFLLNDPPEATTSGELVLRALLRAGGRLRAGERLTLEGTDEAVQIELLDRDPEGVARVAMPVHDVAALDALLEETGQLPLPPYILKRRKSTGVARYTDRDRERYQTVYARAGRAVAAPTAGLHFSEALLEALESRGIERATVTLDVGAGTFRPVRSETLSGHEMHAERYVVEPDLVEAYERARARGGRVVAVGTTVVRALEDQMERAGRLEPGRWQTDLFIRPGHTFRAIDGLITNFHLPRSTLLVLVATFGGYERVMQAYEEAVERGYRFYSYGDAMLLWPAPGDEL